MVNIYLSNKSRSYTIVDSNIKIYGTSNLDDMVNIGLDIKNIYVGSNIENIQLSNKISDYKIVQGFGSNLVIEDLDGNLITNISDVNNKKIIFNGTISTFKYIDGDIFMEDKKVEKISTVTEDISSLSKTLSHINSEIGEIGTLDTEGVNSLNSGQTWSSDLKEISYSFNETIPSYYMEDSLTQGFKPLDKEQRDAVNDITEDINSLLNIKLVETPSDGIIRFSVIDMDDDTAGFAFLPISSSLGGDVFLSSAETNFGIGSYGRATITHELGHALGLKHPFEGEYTLPKELDNTAHSVMSYSDSSNVELDFTLKDDGGLHFEYNYISPKLYSLYDISTLQAIYGANTSTNTANNTYTFSYDKFAYETIWDAGGNDTFNLSATKGKSILDLRGGTINSIDVYSNDEIVKFYQDEVGVSYYNDWIKDKVYEVDSYGLLYTGVNNVGIAKGVIIENAIMGSGDDIVYDNSVDNIINMGSGDDKLYIGEGGYDTIDGGDGKDSLYINVSNRDEINLKEYNDGYIVYNDTFGAEFKNIEIIILGDGTTLSPEELLS